MAGWRRKKDKYTDPDDVRMTLGEHLEELRSRLIRAIVGVLSGAILCFIFSRYVLAFLCSPIFAVLEKHGYDSEMSFLSPAENFITHLKVSIIVGFIISAPYSLMQVWGFVSAGLYKHERKWVRRFVPVSIALFFTGAGFFLLIVSPPLLNFLITFKTDLPNIAKYMPKWTMPAVGIDPIDTVENDQPEPVPSSQPVPAFEKDPETWPDGVPWLNKANREIRYRFKDKIFATRLKEVGGNKKIKPEMRVAEYVMFILHLAAAFGIGFQVPVIVSFLATVGIASSKDMARLRRYVWFGMSVAAAFFTPPDVASMLFLLIPMALLYEVGLIAARIIESKRSDA